MSGLQNSAVKNPDAQAAFLALVATKTAVIWDAPQPIKHELYPVEQYKPDMLPESLRTFVDDIAERMQCPRDYVATTLVSVACTVVGAGCGIKPKKIDDWLVVPNLWGGIVGKPTKLKTPSMAEAQRPLKRLEAKAKEKYDEAKLGYEADLQIFEAKKAASKFRITDDAKGGKDKGGRVKILDEVAARKELMQIKAPDAPNWTRYQTNHASIEKLNLLLSTNPRGINVNRDELTGFFATLDKEGHEVDKAFFLEAWPGLNSRTDDLIGRGTIHTPNMCVSIFGGIQPDMLMEYMHRQMRGGQNDGFMQRMQLLVYPDESSSWTLVDRKPDEAAKKRAYDVIEKLAEANFQQLGATFEDGDRVPYFRFSDDAQNLFYAWWTELESKKLRSDEPSIIHEHLGKYRSLMPSLALVFHLVDVVDTGETGPVSLRAAKLAAAWCEYLESHAKRLYGLVKDLAPRAAVALSERLKRGDLQDNFTVRQVYRKGWDLLSDTEVAEDACSILAEAGWLKDVTERSATGRSPSTTYIINPAVKKGAKNG